MTWGRPCLDVSDASILEHCSEKKMSENSELHLNTIKGLIIRATFFFNLSRNFVALQVETQRCAYNHFVTNLSGSKIQCYKLRRRVAKSTLEFYFLLQILDFLLVLPLKLQLALQQVWNHRLWLAVCESRLRGKFKNQKARNLPYTRNSRDIGVFGTPRISLRKTSSKRTKA